jgi:hypothetical protein
METLKLTKTDATLPEQWERFSERFSALNDRLIIDLENCWRDLKSILERQLEHPRTTAPLTIDQVSLESYRKMRKEEGQRLLIDPLTQWERRCPYKRAMIVIEAYDRNLEELIKSLPESVEASGRQAIDLLEGKVKKGMARRFARLRRKERPLPLRSIVAEEIRRQTLERSETEGEYLLALARAIHQLRRYWEVKRSSLDSMMKGEASQKEEALALQRETKTYAGLLGQATDAISKWRKWPEAAELQIAHRVLEKTVWRRKIKPSGAENKRAAYLAHWGEQLRSLETEIKFELALEKSEDRVLKLLQRGIDSLSRERANLLGELEVFENWLQRRLAGDESLQIPPPRTDIVPSSSRLSEFESGYRAVLQSIPQPVRILTKFSRLPRRSGKPKEFKPAETAFDAYLRAGRDEVALVLQEVELEHQRVVQGIERAREVVSFGLSEIESNGKRDTQIMQEALQNALSLLEFQRKETPAELNESNARLTRTIAAVFDDNRTVLGRNRLGVFAYLGQQGVREAAEIGWQNLVQGTKRLVGAAIGAFQEMTHDFLVYIGWIPETREGISEVIKRPFLPQEFTADLSAKDLPAIYRRLFRFDPVQDPRFLVGREREMEAIAEARAMWETGRPVAVLVIGERGSGKTSLINCAVKRPLEGLDVVRGEFGERLSNAAQLREFLARLLGDADPENIESSLNERRRVVILEELERSFLRQIGHYAAMRELQRLIAATCRSTLWVVVTNQIAFQFLDASVALGQSFSHRVNAASASRDALHDAILLRHNLSGLRLQFSLPPEERTLANRARNVLRGHADPEKIFFDQLAKESVGIFRTAFEIWLGQIDVVQAGAMLMNPLSAPDLAPVISALDLDDLFTLVAVLQHGSLKPEEHATIFQKNLASSRAQIDELLAREIIEPDPGRPGFRVRPEALRVVKEALYRRNLL